MRCMFFVALLIAAGMSAMTPSSSSQLAQKSRLQLSSSAFEHQKPIPRKYTCDGEGVSPPLAWTGVHTGTRSLVLIVDDPDAPDPAAPQRTWVHWVVYNIPPDAAGLPENAAAAGLPPGALEGRNDSKEIGYDPPCPPIGRHRYVHKLYALDIVLPEAKDATKADVEKAMQRHILGQAEWVGTYGPR